MSGWNDPVDDLEWYRRLRDAYSELVRYGEGKEHVDRLWFEERRRNVRLLEEIRHVRSIASSIGTMAGSIPVSHLEKLFGMLEEHDKEMEMPF